MKGEERDEDSILSDWVGPITWAKVVLGLGILLAILACCAINGSRPEFWEFVNG